MYSLTLIASILISFILFKLLLLFNKIFPLLLKSFYNQNKNIIILIHILINNNNIQKKINDINILTIRLKKYIVYNLNSFKYFLHF